MKFKVGDRVQVANDTAYILAENQRKGTVKSLVEAVSGEIMYMVALDNYAVGFDAEQNHLAFRAADMKKTKN